MIQPTTPTPEPDLTLAIARVGLRTLGGDERATKRLAVSVPHLHPNTLATVAEALHQLGPNTQLTALHASGSVADAAGHLAADPRIAGAARALHQPWEDHPATLAVLAVAVGVAYLALDALADRVGMQA